MAFRDLLVLVDATRHCARRVDFAAELASRCQAHLLGLYVVSPFVLPGYAEVQLDAELILAQERQAREDVSRARQYFEGVVARHGLVAGWRSVEGEARRAAAEHARTVDLIIAGQPAPAPDDGIISLGTLILGAGRPVLTVPYIGAGADWGRRVLVAWNGSREAVRAVNDALPLLVEAEQVEVVCVTPHPASASLDAICLHLARWGVPVVAHQLPVGDQSVGPALLSRAAESGADLLVMGAYGHSRLRELILGGVTQEVLADMTLPVFASH